MILNFKHIGLIIGFLLFTISFLFFGRQQETYILLLLCGLLIAIIFYGIIIFSKGTTKSKFTWTVLTILFIIIHWFTDPFMIDFSCRIYIEQNKSELAEIVSILSEKQGEVNLTQENVFDRNKILSKDEADRLIKLIQEIDSNLIMKSENEIYVTIWSFLDTQFGVSNFMDHNNNNNHYRHLTGNWYRP